MSSEGAQRLYDGVSRVLRYGTFPSAAVLAAGLAWLLLEGQAGAPPSLGAMLASGFGEPTLSPTALVSGLASGSPLCLLEVGTLVLLGTPVARVAASVVLFAEERDRAYVAITLAVLGMLLFAIFVLGPAEARGALGG